MKAICYCIIAYVGCLCPAHAQDEPRTPAERLFEQSVDRFENEDFQGAAAGFRQFMVSYPKSPLLARAHYNLALSHMMAQDYAPAKKIFLEILDQSYNEQDENNLMEPYALYKHHSCRHLTEIALHEKDYPAARKYIEMFDKKYPYQHFCGNEWAAYDIFKAIMKAKTFEGMGETKKAIAELLPHIFYNGLASNSDVLEVLVVIIDKHFTEFQKREAFHRALETLKVKETKNGVNATIQLFDVPLDIDDSFLDIPVNVDKGASPIDYYEKVLQEHALFKKYL